MREARFYEAVRASSTSSSSWPTEKPDVINIAFRVKLDPLYGDSAVVRNAINAVVQRTFLSLDNPEFVTLQSKLNEAEAMDAIGRLPGRAEWYAEMADAFLEAESATERGIRLRPARSATLVEPPRGKRRRPGRAGLVTVCLRRSATASSRSQRR